MTFRVIVDDKAIDDITAGGNYFASLRNGSKYGTADILLDLPAGWL